MKKNIPKIKLVKPLQLFMRTGVVRELPLCEDNGDAGVARVLRHGWIEIEWPHNYFTSAMGNARDDAMNMNVLLHAKLSGVDYFDGVCCEGGMEEREIKVGSRVYFFMVQTELMGVRLGEPKFMALNVSATMSTIITINNAPVFSSSMPCGTKVSQNT